MLTPADPAQLASLDAQLTPGRPPASIVAVLDTADVHAETVRGQHTTEAFGRYCRIAVPKLLRRLLDAERDLVTLRAHVARHVAAHDQGDDPTALELLEELRRDGVDLGDDVVAAGEVLEAQAHAAAFA
ncbi:hypothetical protein [Streptomyces niveus]|uniref:hypothetical protein n=1 Tax=Streptomyces niveus TaxID=193462 RepID=UPI0034365417